MVARTLPQVDARLTTEITTRASQVKALQGVDAALTARIAALEGRQFTEAEMLALRAALAAGSGGGGSTPSLPPDPPPDPPPGPPSGSWVSSGPISLTVADSGSPGSPTTIDYKELSSSLDDGAGVSMQGTSPSNRIHDILLRNFKVTGFHSNFLIRFADRITLEDCWVPDGFYCGFNIFSSNNVLIARPRVDRILHALPNAQGNNAYGVKIDVLNGGDPICDTVEVSDGVFKESLLWMNLNAHSGNHIYFLRNKGYRAPRNVFVTSVTDLRIEGNQLLDPATTPGGTTDVTAISYGNVHGASIKDNQIDSDYPSRISNIDAYTGGASTGVVIGSNPIVSYP